MTDHLAGGDVVVGIADDVAEPVRPGIAAPLAADGREQALRAGEVAGADLVFGLVDDGLIEAGPRPSD